MLKPIVKLNSRNTYDIPICALRNKIIAENMATLRRIAFNRMKMFDNSRPKSKK